MAERTSTDILLEDLEAAHAPAFMIRKARDGQYNDYHSDSAHPIIDLLHDAAAANLKDIVVAARAGKYDGTRAESDAWMQSEGQDLFKLPRWRPS